MLESLIVRTILMLGEGTTLDEAILWVTKRLPTNLRSYYARRIFGEVILAGVV